MDTTRLSSKGQIIIPKAVRDAHGWAEGVEFVIEEFGDGIVLRPARLFPATKAEDVFGCLKYDGPPKSLEDMQRGIDDALRERWERKSK
ncbi:MAG: AbrB/MazE/SpoVT family DNA-binding domain-containing protein [Hyphomicrobiaceae bacterium]